MKDVSILVAFACRCWLFWYFWRRSWPVLFSICLFNGVLGLWAGVILYPLFLNSVHPVRKWVRNQNQVWTYKRIAGGGMLISSN